MAKFSGFTRRGAIGAAGLGLAAPQLMAGAAQTAMPKRPHPGLNVRKPAMTGKALLNTSRAMDIMQRYNIAGIVAADPVNVFYLTNVETLGVGFRWQHPGYATLGRDEDVPPHLISGFFSAYDIANQDRETAEIITFNEIWPETIPRDADGVPTEPTGAKNFSYSEAEGLSPTQREMQWRAMHAGLDDKVAANTAWAIARALKAQGVTRGRVAVDDMRIADLLAQTDLVNIQCVPGYEILQLIRMVKSEQELAYQRVGGWNNGEACLATVRAVEAGMTQEDIKNIFRYECAKRGNDVGTLVVGVPGGNFPDGVAVEGKPYVIDGVSHFRHYHGDTARTFTIGEPTQQMRQDFKANWMAREAVFDAFRPGVTFSQLRNIAIETMVKGGIRREITFATPHTVGLQHDDNPRNLKAFGVDNLDIALEENMVLTVDLPFMEIGGSQGHNEDLVRITKTGYELFSPEDDPYIVV